MSNKEMATEKRLKVRLYLSLLVCTVVGYGLTLILDYIFSKFDNGIFAWLYWRLGPLFILYLVIGFVCIFKVRSIWSRLLKISKKQDVMHFVYILETLVLRFQRLCLHSILTVLRCLLRQQKRHLRMADLYRAEEMHTVVC